MTHTVIETLAVVWENSNNVETHPKPIEYRSRFPTHYIQALCYVCSNKACQKAVENFNNRKPIDAQKCQDCM